MEILTPFFNWLAWSGELSLLRSLRLLSRQSNLIASFSLRHISGIPTVPPEEADETNPLKYCDFLVPPPLPKTPIKRAAVEYAIGRELAQTSAGRTTTTSSILSQPTIAKQLLEDLDNENACITRANATLSNLKQARFYTASVQRLDYLLSPQHKHKASKRQQFRALLDVTDAYSKNISDQSEDKILLIVGDLVSVLLTDYTRLIQRKGNTIRGFFDEWIRTGGPSIRKFTNSMCIRKVVKTNHPGITEKGA
jgi:hypothetical protein